jgi:hypothetical protein
MRCSKSTKVSVGQRLWRIFSRVTTSPGPLEERGENLEGSLLELDFVAVAPHFTASKVYFKLSDTEARNCYGWYLHGGHNQLFDFDPNPVPNRCQPGSRL